MYGQTLPLLPPPYRRDVAAKVGGDFLPGVEPFVPARTIVGHGAV
jgi:hypothetical protein